MVIFSNKFHKKINRCFEVQNTWNLKARGNHFLVRNKEHGMVSSPLNDSLFSGSDGESTNDDKPAVKQEWYIEGIITSQLCGVD